MFFPNIWRKWTCVTVFLMLCVMIPLEVNIAHTLVDHVPFCRQNCDCFEAFTVKRQQDWTAFVRNFEQPEKIGPSGKWRVCKLAPVSVNSSTLFATSEGAWRPVVNARTHTLDSPSLLLASAFRQPVPWSPPYHWAGRRSSIFKTWSQSCHAGRSFGTVTASTSIRHSFGVWPVSSGPCNIGPVLLLGSDRSDHVSYHDLYILYIVNRVTTLQLEPNSLTFPRPS